MADTTDLYFDLAAAVRLAEHAAAATDHGPSYIEHVEGRVCPGALVFVKDDGVYLMSSGQPGPSRDHDGHVVYAHGWTPDSPANPRCTHLGGDDFAEHLHLAEAVNDRGLTLLDALRDGHARGHRYLLLKVGDDTFDIAITRDGPLGT